MQEIKKTTFAMRILKWKFYRNIFKNDTNICAFLSCYFNLPSIAFKPLSLLPTMYCILSRASIVSLIFSTTLYDVSEGVRLNLCIRINIGVYIYDNPINYSQTIRLRDMPLDKSKSVHLSKLHIVCYVVYLFMLWNIINYF